MVVETIDYWNDEQFMAMGDDFPGDKVIGEWTGLVVIKDGGPYTFATTSDDGCVQI
jgi:hypothetical protein